MKRLSLALLILMAVCMSGCYGKVKNRINNTMASWEGHHYSELLSSWGPPQQVLDDGSGGRVLIYSQTRSWTTPGQATTTTDMRATQWDNLIWGNATSTTTYTPGQTYGYTSWRMFFIARDGRIYRWAWRGL